MNAWLLWIAAAGVLGVAELLTMGLFLAPLAVAALAAGVLAGLGTGFVEIQGAVALVSE